MGAFSEIKKFLQTVGALNRELKEQDIFNKKVNKMIKPYKPNRQTKREINEKLRDARQLVLIETLGRELGREAKGFTEEENVLLKKYGATNRPEAIAGIVGEINKRYNVRDTDDAKWVDLKVQFFEYSAKNHQELTELKKLASEAKRLQADYLAQKAEDAYQKLVAEEKGLHEMLKNSKPENYKAGWKEMSYDNDCNLIARIIKHKTSLYQEQGRTVLLWSYNQHVKDCGGDPERVEKGILSADQHWSTEEETQSKLESLTQSAQDLREPQAVKSEQVLESNKER